MTEQEERELANFGIKVVKEEAVVVVKHLIHQIYNLSNSISAKFPCLEPEDPIGLDHTERALNDGYPELLAAIENLQSVASIMLKKRNPNTTTDERTTNN